MSLDCGRFNTSDKVHGMKNLMTAICAALEYLVDRGEIEEITKVETKIRYTNKQVESFVVQTDDGKRWRITAKELTESNKGLDKQK